jgi:hypothetical protein
MSAIGIKTSGFGSSTVIDAEPNKAQNLTWNNVMKMLTEEMSTDWFKAYSPMRMDQVYSDAQLKGMSDQLKGLTLLPRSAASDESLGEGVGIEDSLLGRAVINALEELGVDWSFQTRLAISHTESIDVPGLKITGVAQFGTYFGMPFDQTFKIYRSPDGTETCTWSANVLAASRPHGDSELRGQEDNGDRWIEVINEADLEAGALNYGSWSQAVLVPNFLKKLFYVAEWEAAPSLANLPRTLAYGQDIQEGNLPEPFYNFHVNYRAGGAFDLTPQGYLMSSTLMPIVVEAGWKFTTTSVSEIKEILKVITEGLVRMQTVIEDGYLNARYAGHPAPFDSVLYSSVIFDSDTTPAMQALGLSYWIPGPRVGLALHETNSKYEAASLHEDFETIEDLAFNGVGPSAAAAINTFIYKYMLDSEHEYIVDRLALRAFGMNVKDESTNAICNWGIYKYRQANKALDAGEANDAIRFAAEAIVRFQHALDRPDKFSEAEASWYLSILYRAINDDAKSQEFWDRCQAAGGYNDGSAAVAQPATETPATQAVSASSTSPTQVGAAKFCAECGEKFEKDTAKFCQSCGTPR